MKFFSGVKNLSGNKSYDLYFDRYGYLVAMTETATSGDFTLLVDGWYMTQRSGNEYAALAYIDGELVDTDITKGGDLFIDTTRSSNTWNALEDFSVSTNTIVGSLSDDGVLKPVEDVYNKKQINIIATDTDKDTGVDIIPGKAYVGGTAYYTGNAKVAYDTKGISDTNKNSDVEVRALSSTVYYYVYGSGKNTTVKTYTGYANIPELYAEDIKYIEDVYVVGTQVDRESGLGEATYYTANVVVVEFSKAYRTNAEQVFIYDVPEVGKNVKIESVEVIRADGTTATVEIDFSKSDIRTYLPAYGKAAYPGLYYMWESNTEGVYIIESMDQDDIAASRYTTGWVITTDGTGKEDYTEILAFTYKDAISLNDNQGDRNANADTPEYTITADSKLYTLSYKYDNDKVRNDYVADLKSDDMDVVLAERVDVVKKNDATRDVHNADLSYNYNDVLVSYDKNGNVIYAISFANYDGKNVNFAQYVWNNAKPAAETVAETAVTFYGVKAVKGADADFEATVSYADAKRVGDNGIAVAGGKIVRGDETTELNVKGATYEGFILGEDGNYYTFKLVQEAASKETVLVSDINVIKIDTKIGSIDYTGSDKMSIEEFESHLKALNNAQITSYKYTNDQGTVTDKSQTLANVKTAEITVVAEDGTTTQVYQLKKDAEDAALAAAQKAALDLLDRAAEARVDFILTIAEKNNLKLTDADKDAILKEMAGDLAGYQNQIKAATTVAAVKALIEKQDADADGMIIKGTLADYVKGAGWNAATKVSDKNKADAAADAAQASNKKNADERAANYMKVIESKLAAGITWNNSKGLKQLVQDVIDAITTGELNNTNLAEYAETITVPADLSFEGDHGSTKVSVEISVTNTYGGTESDTLTKSIEVTVNW